MLKRLILLGFKVSASRKSGKVKLRDLGFLGINKDYDGKILIPFKRKKKQILTEEQKEHNKNISKIRVKVEHSIGGMKRFRILSDRLRMRSVISYSRFEK